MYFSTPNCVRMNKDCSVSRHPQILSNLLRKHTEEESDTLYNRGKTTEPWSVPPGREAASFTTFPVTEKHELKNFFQ